MGIGYQFSDRRSIDYELWCAPGLRMALRGPRTIFDPSRPHWTFVGAAQTFGRFAEEPFPALVSSYFCMPHLNLGFAGAGPEFFVNSPALIEKINRSEVCFLQVMSGRSVSTSLLKTVGFGGVLEFKSGPLVTKRFLAADAYRHLVDRYGRDAAAEQVREARENWVAAYRRLMELIQVPIIGVWISTNRQECESSAEGESGLLGDFPHLITRAELEVFRDSGLPVVGGALAQRTEQLLLDYTTRKPVQVYDSKKFASRENWSRAFNTYYPTPEMHKSVANDLLNYLIFSGEYKRFGRPHTAPASKGITHDSVSTPARVGSRSLRALIGTIIRIFTSLANEVRQRARRGVARWVLRLSKRAVPAIQEPHQSMLPDARRHICSSGLVK